MAKHSIFDYFPEDRMSTDFSWALWLVGWLGILKAFVWIATDPNLPADVARALAYKYSLSTIPLALCGVALWNKKRWAIWGLIICATADLIFLVAVPGTFISFEVKQFAIFPFVFAGALFFINGPVADVLILLLVPALFKAVRDARD